MKEPNYIEAIKNSWELLWHHKSLWALGVLAIFVGQFGLGDFVGKIWVFGEQLIKDGKPALGWFSSWFFSFFFSGMNFWVLTWLFILGLAIFIFIVFVSVVSQGALVSAFAHGFKNKKLPSFDKFWQQGVNCFWRLFIANVIQKITIAILLFDLIYIWQFLFLNGGIYSGILMTLSLAVVLFLGFVVSIIFIYAVAYIVIDNKNLKEAFNLSYNLFSKHVLTSIELSVILLFMGLLMIAGVATVFLIFFIPSVLIGLVAGLANSLAILAVGFIFGVILALIFLLLASGLFNAFTIGAWTYMFMRMHKEGMVSRIMHHIYKIIKRKK